METLHEVALGLLGDKSLAQYLILFIFIMIGVLGSIRIGALRRNKKSNNTPFHFSYAFLTIDNFVRGLGSLCIAFTVIRFGEEIIHREITEVGAIAVGACFDQLVGGLGKAKALFIKRFITEVSNNTDNNTNNNTKNT